MENACLSLAALHPQILCPLDPLDLFFGESNPGEGIVAFLNHQVADGGKSFG